MKDKKEENLKSDYKVKKRKRSFSGHQIKIQFVSILIFPQYFYQF